MIISEKKILGDIFPFVQSLGGQRGAPTCGIVAQASPNIIVIEKKEF